MIDVPRRMPWLDVPRAVRTAVGDLLGSPVVAARTQSGGFSPGSADRVVTADGTRAFVKTASAAVNAESLAIHRREARVSGHLPPGIPSPPFLGLVDEGDWVAIVFGDVEGRHPRTPWQEDELDAALDALAAVADPVLPETSAFPALEDEMAGHFGGWSRLDDVGSLELDGTRAAWVEDHHADLTIASDRALDDVRGDRLVHQDARADNILIRPDGTVVLVDWPWASRGVGWFDPLALLVNVRLTAPHADVEATLRAHRAFHGMPSDAATRVLIALAGFFLEASTQPPKPGLPSLRSFQRDQGIAAIDWARERLGQ